jgi:hypothetical protein
MEMRFLVYKEVIILKFKKFKIPRIRDPVGIIDSIVVLFGIAMIGKGLYMIYPPLMYICIGVILAFPISKKGEAK